jgi:predicted RNase H-like HicB family nuclease
LCGHPYSERCDGTWIGHLERGTILSVKLFVTLERDETGVVVAECPAIPGCVSQGATDEEALSNIREAIIGCLEVRAEQGLPLTVRTAEVEVAVG